MVYHCEVPHGPVIWTIRNVSGAEEQIQDDARKDYYASMTGLIIHDNETNESISEITVTQRARNHFGHVLVIGCLPNEPVNVDSVPTYAVITYGMHTSTYIQCHII